MNESSRLRFDLADFVVGYLEQHESIVAPPAFGVYEALLPDELAAELKVSAYQRLVFSASQNTDALQLTYNHPFVEEIAGRLQEQAANACVYVNHVHLNKQGLLDLARQEYAFPNARLSPTADTVQSRSAHHYLRFNFKVALISDEKQEFLLSVVMNVQGGYPERDAEVLERLRLYETSSAFEGLSTGTLQWNGESDPLSQETFVALLPRAKAAALNDMAAAISALQSRTERHLELDRARIEGYFDDLEMDLRQRQARIAASDETRQANIEEKLSALHTERQMKLTHLAARYRVRVELELINLLLLVQPKLRLPVTISNRTTSVTRIAVWDPLVHRLEPLICDVCGQPGHELYLCVEGHLTHSQCLTSQCIDCSRVYCQLCSDQVGECAVCHEPVCQRSLIACATCGRGTCREHQMLCHAANGEPVNLAATEAPPTEPDSPVIEAAAPTPTPQDRLTRHARPIPERPRKAPAPKGPKLVKAIRIYVDVHEDEPVIRAHVMRSTKRTWAVRTISLTPNGIDVSCDCEKNDECAVNGYFFRPADARFIGDQIAEMLKRLRSEYLTPAKKVSYHYGNRFGYVRESQVFTLPAIWQDPDRLKEAQRGFDHL